MSPMPALPAWLLVVLAAAASWLLAMWGASFGMLIGANGHVDPRIRYEWEIARTHLRLNRRSARILLLAGALPPLALWWGGELAASWDQMRRASAAAATPALHVTPKQILLYDALVYTGFEAVVGLLIGATFGFLCAWLFVSVPLLRAGALPIAAALNSIPIVAVAPIAVLWLGFGQPSKIAVVALMTFAPMVVNAFKGLYSVDRQALDLMDSVAATPWQVFVKLRVPSSLPYVFSALKVGITLALIGALVSEFFNAHSHSTTAQPR